MMETGDLKERYLGAADKFRLQAAEEEKILFILSLLRLICFAAGIILIWIGFTVSVSAGFLLIIPSVILFLYLLKLYSKHTCRKQFLGNLAEINSREAVALSGDSGAFNGGDEFINPDHAFSNDVDLFGRYSLFQYLNRTITSYGREILAGWLSDPYAIAGDLGKRQEVIKELAGKEKWRHGFMASGLQNPLERRDIAALLEWLNESNEFRSSRIKRLLIYLLPIAAVISLILVITGVLHYQVFIFVFLSNLLFIASGLKRTNRIHSALSKKYYYLSSMDSLINEFGNESFDSEILKDIQTGISEGEVSAAGSVRKLSRLIQSFDSRMNILVGFLLNGLLLWDYHSIYRLEKWKAEYSRHFPVWLEMLGNVDAYISLGNFSFNNPGFTFPSISAEMALLSASDLGHPLIEKSDRVCNDFKLEKKGTVCVITGANMSGKSTFLRTLAVNYILAMSGAPVCSGEMYFKPVQLFTSMRTTDSLSNHESYFYAELKRLRILKSLVEKGQPVLFILDEILKGTNSADKSLGSKLFLKRLIELGGTGLIATHDISVGELESEYPGTVINRCFEVEIEGENIKFDFKLRDGITHKMNAAILMKQMGILG